MNKARKPDYGVDSPAIVCGQLIIGLLAMAFAVFRPRIFGLQLRWIEIVAVLYFLHGAFSMLRYSKVGKLRLRELLLNTISWRGDETVLDLGCGKGLLLAGAAHRLKSGKAVGVDLWYPHALSGNGSEAALRNCEIEGVRDRVEVKSGDVRALPFGADAFDVVVSNFVLHEMATSTDRERMLHEIVRVLKPGGRLALIDFIFTKECVDVLNRTGLVNASRKRIGAVGFWVAAILMMGAFQTYAVIATKGIRR